MNAVTSFQHLDDIEVPDIEIAPGWAVSEIETLEDCDDAFAVLTAACAAIEMQVDSETFKPLPMQNGEWIARAKSALRYKKAALSIVQTKRSRINAQANIDAHNTSERLLLEFIRGCVTPKQWLDWVTAHNTATPTQTDKGE